LDVCGSGVAGQDVQDLESQGSGGELEGAGEEPDDGFGALVLPGQGAASGQVPDGVRGEVGGDGGEVSALEVGEELADEGGVGGVRHDSLRFEGLGLGGPFGSRRLPVGRRPVTRRRRV
jgi:hypothetical protein